MRRSGVTRAAWPLLFAAAALAACNSDPVVGGPAPADATPEVGLDAAKDVAPEATPGDVAPDMAGCPQGFTLCSGRCADLVNDNTNCGACGTACPSGRACVMGACQLRCPDGQTACGDRCVSLQTDTGNCGACGTACPAGQVCTMGACDANCGSLATCGAGAMRACANTMIDPANCGGCGMACTLPNTNVAACAAGMCVAAVCNAGFANCDGMSANGCEVNVRGDDAANCGACGNTCRFANAAATCAMGVCAMGACAAGYADCDMNPANGCETNTGADNANCGMCGRACAAGQVCAAGSCGSSCGGGTTACSGDCVNTMIDPANCGRCGNACRLANASVNACSGGACVVGGCNAGFGDCDSNPSNGCEVNVRGADANNCGGCAVRCAFPNAAATCAAGSCALGACNMGFANCDTNAANGCEANTAADNANCGMCGRACAAGQVCSAGVCTSSCGAGTTNCSGDCVNTQTDPGNCGMCGNACRPPNASLSACVMGACVVAACNAGFGDCDGNVMNGCETNVRGSDVNNCGACNLVCRFPNAAATCASGSCAMGACAAGFADCDRNPANGCETNTNTDNANCGTCGRACGAGQACGAGSCATSCGAGTTNCSGACVNTATDPMNCGACARACSLPNVATNACVGSACVVGGCAAGFGDCDASAANGCETAIRGSDVNNCGGCGVVCAFPNAAATCGSGTCALGACTTGFGNCDGSAANGCEANTNTDNRNCGGCGRACAAGQVCAAGACTTSCGSGTTDCSGACVNTQTDPRNCGACGRACALPNVATNACSAGACVIGGCAAGFGDCNGTAADGCEVNVRGTDVTNCGGCGVRCVFANAAATCGSGTCALGACNAGFANCDGSAANGCEVSLNADNGNCGACNRACASGQVCASGTCMSTCATGTTLCAGVCVNLTNDPRNCGACGTTCALPNAAASGCAASACTVLACNTGFGDCDGTAANGCETNVTASATNCGMCGRACAAGQTCVSGTCTSTVLSGTVYQVVGLSADSCNAIEHNTVSGDDRGGIALSSSQVFYRGDSATARFAAADLSGAASTGAGQDGLFSDLATQQVYAFGTAAGPWVFDFSGTAVTLDRFFAINATTGAVGSATMLSATIRMEDYSLGYSTQGIFSGMGRVVVIAAGRVYDIALPSGLVVDRGGFTFPAHTPCESPSVFGVAEFFGGALYIDYVQSSTVIARQQVAPTVTAPATLATFSNLSDMCSFTVSPQTNRWYWHHEGSSQFRSGDESIGYCNMVRRNCAEVLAAGGTASGVYTIDPDGSGPLGFTSVYCDQANDGGGWTLVGRLGDPRYFPQADRNLGAITSPGGSGNILHTNYAAITGTAIRVGRQVGTGTNTGNLYQISDCTTGDASCWYGRYIAQNDGDTFGAWITAGGNWGFVPGGCTTDQCPTTGGDRDHSLPQRIAIFGGDCHYTCASGGDDVRNGLTYRDYGDATSPQRVGNRGWWGAGTVTPSATALGVEIPNVDYGENGTQWRDLWIR
ncbi:MAG: fibrinogen-like YCDxxxxGGGW domain-containing protein [Polyangiales bacterium]